MKQRFGAILCLLLGTVLTVSGFSGSGDATAGTAAPTACGGTVQVGAIVNPGTCPTGSIDITEVSDVTADPGADKPASWSLTVSSVGATTCNLPPSGTTITVTDGGTATFSGLYIYASSDTADQTQCAYSIAETAVTGFTSSFAPSAPYSFTYIPERDRRGAATPADLNGPSPLAVTVTNTAAAPPVTTAPASSTPVTTPPTSAPSSTASSSAATSTSATTVSSSSAATVATSSSAVIANTGPRGQVRFSLAAGIALLLLGSVLLFAGRTRRLRRHG